MNIVDNIFYADYAFDSFSLESDELTLPSEDGFLAKQVSICIIMHVMPHHYIDVQYEL